MENFIKHIEVRNFKSIEHLKLDNCRRINLFVGYPNMGKTNVLEALSLFSIPYLNNGDNLNKLIRVKNRNELFYDLQNPKSEVITNIVKAFLNENSQELLIQYKSDYFEADVVFEQNFELKQDVKDFSELIKNESFKNIKRYSFIHHNETKFFNYNFLLPPHGENIISILANDMTAEDGKINEWIGRELERVKMDFVLDLSDNSIKSQKRFGAGRVRSFPYSSFSDTIQRVIFYKTAIASNKNSVLLFEEPETHSFPPYISIVVQDIIDSESNQFFIVTHSPLIVNAFLEYKNIRRDTSIFLFDFKDNQTVAKQLTDDDLDEIYEYGEDLFFNLESFL